MIPKCECYICEAKRFGEKIMNVNLEEDIEPFLDNKICQRYWDTKTDHYDFRKIVDAIDTGGGQTCDITGVLRELYRAGYIITKIINNIT